MPTKQHILRWEPIGLLALFLLFLFGAYHFEQVAQETEPQDQPSSLATTKPGAGALYQLLDSLGYHVARLTQPWSALNATQSLLVVIEPLSRTPEPAEIAPLQHWIEQGGTLLYIAAKVPRGEDPQDTVAGDMSLKTVPADLSHPAPAVADSPYTDHVTTIAATSTLRIVPSATAGYQVLFRDGLGILAAHKPLGKGHVVLVTDDQLATNAGIKSDDNAIFLVNIASAATHLQDGSVVFDEYHHGVGFETEVEGASESLFGNMPPALRFTLLDLSAFGLLLVFVGNRRSRPLRRVPEVAFRPTADYVNSMARLHKRAGATDLALNAIYQRFLRDLRRELNVFPGTRPDQLVPLIQSQFHVNGQEIYDLLTRCEQIAAGMRVPDSELVNLSSRIDHFRREFGIVRPQ